MLYFLYKNDNIYQIIPNLYFMLLYGKYTIQRVCNFNYFGNTAYYKNLIIIINRFISIEGRKKIKYGTAYDL